jgi:diacylglycerol kinase (ATP)
MTSVAVIAHARKKLGGGLPELRRVLATAGVTDPLWYEVPKSKQAPARVREALKDGADLVFVWGGDGIVQRCVDALAGSGALLAILPAGTANQLATSLGIPQDLEAAVQIGLHGARRKIDVGVLNGERFAVMAGTGFDALMIRSTGRKMKDRFGRAAYVWTGMKQLRARPMKARVTVDGKRWF